MIESDVAAAAAMRRTPLITYANEDMIPFLESFEGKDFFNIKFNELTRLVHGEDESEDDSNDEDYIINEEENEEEDELFEEYDVELDYENEDAVDDNEYGDDYDESGKRTNKTSKVQGRQVDFSDD